MFVRRLHYLTFAKGKQVRCITQQASEWDGMLCMGGGVAVQMVLLVPESEKPKYQWKRLAAAQLKKKVRWC